MNRFLACLLAISLVFVSACQRTPWLETKVAAETSRDFARWQTSVRGDCVPAEWEEWEAALQDIKVRIIALREATGTEAVNEALLPKINGKTVRQVLQQAYEARLWRLNVEREELEKIIAGNSTLRTNAGDSASADYLKRANEDKTARLKRTQDEIAKAEARLKELGAPGGATMP